jgi:lipopolysaccharide export system protein LptA
MHLGAIFLLAWLAANPAAPQGSIDIVSDKLQLRGLEKRAVWTGHVKAKRGSTDIWCNELVAYFREDQTISRLECTGAVEVFDKDKYAKGDRADFDHVKGILQITGSPEAREGTMRLWGTKVTLDVNKDKMYVENPRSVMEQPTGPQKRK